MNLVEVSQWVLGKAGSTLIGMASHARVGASAGLCHNFVRIQPQLEFDADAIPQTERALLILLQLGVIGPLPVAPFLVVVIDGNGNDGQKKQNARNSEIFTNHVVL